MPLITLVTRRAADHRTDRSMFVPAWFSNEPTRSMPQDDRQIAPTLLSRSRDLAGAKRIAEAAAGRPLKWEAYRALRAFSSNALVGREDEQRQRRLVPDKPIAVASPRRARPTPAAPHTRIVVSSEPSAICL
jgi:hypothetical protein